MLHKLSFWETEVRIGMRKPGKAVCTALSLPTLSSPLGEAHHPQGYLDSVFGRVTPCHNFLWLRWWNLPRLFEKLQSLLACLISFWYRMIFFLKDFVFLWLCDSPTHFLSFLIRNHKIYHAVWFVATALDRKLSEDMSELSRAALWKSLRIQIYFLSVYKPDVVLPS